MNRKNNNRQHARFPDEDPNDPAWVFRAPPPTQAEKLREQLRKVQTDRDFYKKAFAHQQKQVEALTARVKELESRPSQCPHKPRLTTHSIFTESIVPISTQPSQSRPAPTQVATVKPAPRPISTVSSWPKTIVKPKPTPPAQTRPTSLKENDAPVPLPSEHSPSSPAPSQRTSTPPEVKSATKPALLARQFFQAPENTLSHFQYVYIPCKKRLPRPQIRQYLRTIGIHSARVLDLAFPARHVIGLLIHDRYLPELTSRLQEAKISSLPNFDPTDPTHLRDPAYSSLPPKDRQKIAILCQRNRCLRAIATLQDNVKRVVAKLFVSLGWLTTTDMIHILNPDKCP
ncbi:hypothetical protein EC973_002253 [Apophysomyces ossiformis]|uniref:Uncharacterized protein n=1 Tax=Apophysomyces ossiformis TaxID=679940 RepID=A0A8H7BTS7_9FUNG|nr:hypothetical protein EC973_002253 [Apophysomyces ossiformis]